MAIAIALFAHFLHNNQMHHRGALTPGAFSISHSPKTAALCHFFRQRRWGCRVPAKFSPSG